MFTQFLNSLMAFLKVIESQFMQVLNYPLSSTQRIFWLYLVCAMAFAFIIFYKKSHADNNEKLTLIKFVRFLFPTKVWSTSSAWLDVRYFFFHQMVRLVIYGTMIGAMFVAGFELIANIPLKEAGSYTGNGTTLSVAISIAYMFILVALLDLVSYWIHYLQHHVSFLWEFHRVHHSLEVMHPLSNYREHPIDNIVYAVGTGGVYGLISGLAYLYLDYIPQSPSILGLPVLFFAFNVLAYNLRHSHIWLRWPGNWSKLFASPAHHHVHHSYHPDQINKNFAFIFPWWDVLFRTYCMPDTNKDVKFGIAEGYQGEFKSCLGIYFIPIKNTLSNLIKVFKTIL